nr:GSCFA domain-containing protein [Shimia sp. Alg240-R146]
MTKIVTAGSCFAQHVGRTLANSGFNVLDGEPVPLRMSDALANRFGYKLFSGRYGNIYTVRQLVQMMDEAEGLFQPATPVWEKNGRYYDAMRPNVEPEGLESPELVMKQRKEHLKKVLETYKQADLFVFTFGLTEAWIHKESGTVYPTAPGTIAGSFDPELYEFKNFGFTEIMADFVSFRKRMKKYNPAMKFLITVSPVPLTATASGNHVEVATSYSKSVLRTVCGTLYDKFRDVDYFPSYEIITSPNNRGVYFESNKRSVSSKGVATAMGLFLQAHNPGDDAEKGGATAQKAKKKGPQNADKAKDDEDAVCEDALLEAFAR